VYLTYQQASAIYEAACAYFARLASGDCSLEEHAKAVEEMEAAYEDLRRRGPVRPRLVFTNKVNIDPPF